MQVYLCTGQDDPADHLLAAPGQPADHLRGGAGQAAAQWSSHPLLPPHHPLQCLAMLIRLCETIEEG